MNKTRRVRRGGAIPVINTFMGLFSKKTPNVMKLPNTFSEKNPMQVRRIENAMKKREEAARKNKEKKDAMAELERLTKELEKIAGGRRTRKQKRRRMTRRRR